MEIIERYKPKRQERIVGGFIAELLDVMSRHEMPYMALQPRDVQAKALLHKIESARTQRRLSAEER